MTTAQSSQRQSAAAQHAVLAQRLCGIFGATGVKTAARPQQWADHPLVDLDQRDKETLHLSFTFCQILSIATRSARLLWSALTALR